MEKQVQDSLLEINRRFYDQFAPSFSATRDRAQIGVRDLMRRFATDATLLDLGCGNGTLARSLASAGFTGRYLGVDMSAGLLSEADTLLGEPLSGTYHFQRVDLSDPDWNAAISDGPFDWLVSFAVLHHLPGADFRLRTVRAFADLISQTGQVAVSVWQWQNSVRLSKRVLPWSEVGLVETQVDAGDVLLDWRAGDQIGLRYVHTFSETSLTALAETAGFRVTETFYSDGKTGNLALYQVWQLA